MVGSTISHYKILSELGRGAMGVVYKAEDNKLERPVALKFLAAHAIEDPEHKVRFVREAKAAAWITGTFARSTRSTRLMGKPCSPWPASKAKR